MVTRRRFLSVGAAAAAAGLVSGSLFGDIPRVSAFSRGIENSTTSGDSLRPLIGSRFRVLDHANGTESYLKLIEVNDIENPLDKKSGIERESYSLLLQGRKDNLLEQGIYEFTHSSMPDFEILVVPVTGEAAIYEVNFNNLRS